MVWHKKSKQKNWVETRKILKKSCLIKAGSMFPKLLELNSLATTMTIPQEPISASK